MTALLFPGRHLVHTAFQEHFLRRVLGLPLTRLEVEVQGTLPDAGPIDEIWFAITSANQQHSRYNPIPFHVRAIGVDRFARRLEAAFRVRYRLFGIPHYAPTSRFGRYVLREIEEQSEGDVCPTPATCVVLSSTPSVIEMYRELGYAVLTAERAAAPMAGSGALMRATTSLPATPMELVRAVVDAGEGWDITPAVRAQMAPATFDLWHDFPEVPRRVLRLWRDPLLNASGSLTDSRDYNTYAHGMSQGAILDVKYDDLRAAIVPGKIVDEGCADGALLTRIARDFPDSDLIGIEITGEFMARCLERQRAGGFGGTFAHFHQRNLNQAIFEPGSIDTTLCNSTLHELWSYGDGASTVQAYLARKYQQTRRGGRLLIRDVVGPAERERLVHMELARDDGDLPTRDDFLSARPQPKDSRAVARYLDGLCTYARFLCFARDFLANRRRSREGDDSGSGLGFYFREETIAGSPYVVLPLWAAAEFLSKKDYTDNWYSEMHEEFAFWSFARWKEAVRTAGFAVVEDADQPKRGSRVYTSEWIVRNRYRGKARLYARDSDGGLSELPYPPTNIVLVAEKR